MNNVIELIIYNTIIITFPILMYTIFFAYKKKFIKEKRELFDDAFLFCSFFISIYFCRYLDHLTYAIVTYIPLLLCYKKGNQLLAFLMSLILFDFHTNLIKSSFTIVFLILLSYHIIYQYYSTRTKSTNSFILYTHGATLIFFTLEFILKCDFHNIILIKEFLAKVAVFTFVLYFTHVISSKAKRITNTFMTLEELEREKELKLNLFKIAHEVKNPIAIIKGYTDMFDPTNVSKSKRYIEIIKQEVINSLNILSDFSDFTKIKQIKKEEMSVNELLDEIKSSVSPFFNTKNIVYYFKAEEDIKIQGDYNRLKQVLINLLKNSIEASNDYTEISLSSFKSNGKLYIFIKDNGKGMDKETLENIFTPFYSKKANGTGLGLTLSKEIIEAHNGTIKYTSIVDRGTTVKIVLPIS